MLTICPTNIKIMFQLKLFFPDKIYLLIAFMYNFQWSYSSKRLKRDTQQPRVKEAATDIPDLVANKVFERM